MTLEAIVVAIIVGLVAGWLFRTLGIASGGGWVAMVGVAFVGAVILIVAQRMLWQVRT